ncbi:unnamed protein product, partial [Amoebophrya sp. A120]
GNSGAGKGRPGCRKDARIRRIAPWASPTRSRAPAIESPPADYREDTDGRPAIRARIG